MSRPANGRKVLGDYELLEEVARGGMGVVHRARQRSVDRFVAVKVLLDGFYAKETARRRFRREAESTAALSHPNIVPVYETGEDSGQLYLAMELVEGRSFAELTRDSPLDPREAAALVKSVAEGIQYAHQNNVLHRDLKPSNVLLDNFGIPRITDFGLAKPISTDEEMTVTGQVLGSPNYMPPEQADPNRGPVTRASDVYSLGAILYQLLTARPPFQANSLAATLRQVVEQEPIPVRLLNPSAPRDLETICARCLEKESKRRFASAQELVEELGRFLNNEPILTRPAGKLRRLAKWQRRNPTLAAAVFSAAFLLGIIAIGAPIAVWRIDRERANALRAERSTRQELYTALLDESRSATLSAELGHRVQTLEALRRAAQITNTAELRREALAALRLPDLRLEREGLRHRSGSLSAWALDPQFRRVAEANEDESVRISDVTTGRLLARLAPTAPGPADQFTWSPDGKCLALKRGAGGDSQHWTLEVWDASAFRCVYSKPTMANRPVFCLDGRALFNVTPGGTVSVIDLVNTNPISSYSALNGQPLSDPQDRGFLITVGGQPDHFAQCHFENGRSVLRIRRIDDGTVLNTFNLDSHISSLAWQPLGTWIALTEFSGDVSLLDASSGQTHRLGHHKAQAVSAVFTPDGHYLFTGGWERELICWDMGSLQKSFSIPLDSFNLQVNAMGTRCAVDSRTSWQIHHFERPSAQRTLLEVGPGRGDNAAFSPDGRWLAVAGFDRLGLWSTDSGAPPVFAPILRSDGSQEHVAFCGSQEFYAWRDSACELWRITSGKNPAQPPKLDRIPVQLPRGLISISQMTNGVVITSRRGSAIVTPATTEANWIKTETGLNAVSPNGRWLSIFPPFSNVARIYDLPSFTAVADLTNSSSISRVEFSPSGSEVALSSMRGSSIWSTVAWRLERELTNTMELIFTSSGSFWLMDDFRNSGLYSATPNTQRLLPLPRGALPRAASPDGSFLVVSMDAAFVELWDMREIRGDLRELGLDWQDPP